MLKNWSKTQTYSREAASSQISSNSNGVFFFFFFKVVKINVSMSLIIDNYQKCWQPISNQFSV